MNKAEFIKRYNDFLTKYKISPEEIHASHGGSLLMLGLRDSTGDLDLTVNQRVWELFNTRKVLLIDENWRLRSVDNYIDIHPAEEVVPDSDIINEGNVRFRSAERTLRDKKKLNRDKDVQDIKNLKKYLNSNSGKRSKSW